jgi:NADH:ubiquinone oxidoreductase subunit F (NADH-binding)
MEFHAAAIPGQKYLVCNLTRAIRHVQGSDILRYKSHSVIEGMIIAGYATAARSVTTIHGEIWRLTSV